jgi:hypothetical protein
MTKGRYIGGKPHLSGKTALLMKRHPAGFGNPRKVYAQFDDRTITEAFGWHEFDECEFRITGTATRAMV